MHQLDPARVDLAREFKDNPIGPHSPELQRVLLVLRGDPPTRRWIAAQPLRGGPWYLARTTGPKGCPVALYQDHPYRSAEQAQWAVFRMRWRERTGEIPTFAGDVPDPSAGAVTASDAYADKVLLGYCDPFSVEAGGRLEFKVSCTQPGTYHAQIVRLRCGDRANLALRQSPVPAAVAGEYPGRRQGIEAGSYVAVDHPVGELGGGLNALALQCYVWPTLPGGGCQALLGTWNETRATGFGLFLDADGALALRIGDGQDQATVSTGVGLLERHWYLVGASIDLDVGVLWVGQRMLRPYARTRLAAQRAGESGPVASGGDFRIAAWNQEPAAEPFRAPSGGHYNGKLEAPLVLGRALTLIEREALIGHGAPVGADPSCLAHWDFASGIPGDRVRDCSGRGRHARAVNFPTRAMKGVHWDGTEYNWSHRPEHYGAIHFHDDDLYDCGWDTDFTLEVPADLPSGLYAAYLRQGEHEDWIPFVVRPPLGAARARLALVLPTASYWAYANRHTIIDFPGRELVRGAFTAVDATAVVLHHHPELGLSMYDSHRDGSGVCYSSRLRPVLSLRPDEALWQLPADTHIIDWLDEMGIAYDVLTEDDLDRDGEALLAPYRCVVTGTHPEYPSRAMLDAIEAFQQGGGRFIYLGGNGFYWRVSYHPERPGMMEMRRAEDGIRAWLAEGGEYYHASTGELGGMWRRMGRAPQSVAGTGMTAQGFDRSTYYLRTAQSTDPRAAFIFEGIGEDERIGDFGFIGGGAAGWEIDRADPALGTPPHALVVARAEGFSANYHWMKEELTHTHSAITGETAPAVHADMVFYETPNGGAVFSVSSIAWAGALAHQRYRNNVSRITENVIRRFLDPAPF